MGMYTSLVISARIKPDAPPEFMVQLKALLAGDLHIREVLGGEACRNPLCRTSAYFPESSRSLEETRHPSGWTLNVVSQVKNYDGEIEGIIKWMRPHIYSGHGASDWWAIVTYEEDEKPTIYYMRDPT